MIIVMQLTVPPVSDISGDNSCPCGTPKTVLARFLFLILVEFKLSDVAIWSNSKYDDD